MDWMGFVPATATVTIYFTTHATTGAAVAPNSAFEAADIRLYKDGSATQRTSESGWTMTSPFDSIVGLHQLRIDLTDNTDAGFYTEGSIYTAILSPDETVDGLAVVRVLATFAIGVQPADTTRWLGTAAATPTVNGVPEVDVTHWLGTGAQGASGRPQVDVELIEGADPTDTIRDAVVDDATRIDASALNTASVTTIPAILDDTDLIDDATSGLAKIATDVAAILVDTGTTLQGELDGIQADTEDIQSRLPAALSSGNIKADVFAMQADVIGSSQIQSDAIGAAEIAADAIGASELAAGAATEIADAILARALAAETYATDGAVPTLSQALYMIWAMLAEKSVSSTTVTVKKLDGSTTAMTFTIDDETSPTSITRAS